jgi:two-component system, OmpR family, KDP operon response regulator KdpE
MQTPAAFYRETIALAANSQAGALKLWSISSHGDKIPGDSFGLPLPRGDSGTLEGCLSSIQQLRVLVGDGEPATREFVRASLSGSGFAVAGVGAGEDSVDYVRWQPVDLVLLDMSIPGMSGIEACWQIRVVSPATRIVMVTDSVSKEDAQEDKVRALEAGADDCITKPFQVRELVARFNAILRRTNTHAVRQPQKLQAGDLRLDFERGSLWKAGQEVSLSPKEFDLLAVLMKNEGVPMSKTQLLSAAWGPECDEAQNLRTYIRKLRRKVEDNPARPQYLLTEAWMGYRFCHPSEPSAHHAWRGAGREMPAPHGLLRYQLPRHNHAKLRLMRIDKLRQALRDNAVSFPNPVPVFPRHDRPDLQWKLVLLYFVRGWHCEDIAVRYGLFAPRVHQILKTWARRAIEKGYVEYFPPSEVLGHLLAAGSGAIPRRAAEPRPTPLPFHSKFGELELGYVR